MELASKLMASSITWKPELADRITPQELFLGGKHEELIAFYTRNRDWLPPGEEMLLRLAIKVIEQKTDLFRGVFTAALFNGLTMIFSITMLALTPLISKVTDLAGGLMAFGVMAAAVSITLMILLLRQSMKSLT